MKKRLSTGSNVEILTSFKIPKQKVVIVLRKKCDFSLARKALKICSVHAQCSDHPNFIQHSKDSLAPFCALKKIRKFTILDHVEGAFWKDVTLLMSTRKIVKKPQAFEDVKADGFLCSFPSRSTVNKRLLLQNRMFYRQVHKRNHARLSHCKGIFNESFSKNNLSPGTYVCAVCSRFPRFLQHQQAPRNKNEESTPTQPIRAVFSPSANVTSGYEPS